MGERVWEWSLSLRVRCAAAGAAICDADSAVFFLGYIAAAAGSASSAAVCTCVCVWRRHLTAKCREMRCVAALRCSAAGPPIDPSFYYRECASVQVCTRTQTHMHNIYMYVCKWEKSTMGVGSCHFACPCMSVHAYNTIYFMWFFFAQFAHIFLTLVAVRKRETEIDVAKISFFPFFWLTICWRKLWIWFVVFVVVANEF